MGNGQEEREAVKLERKRWEDKMPQQIGNHNTPRAVKRDPEMHLAKKGNQWRFGMKCHVGVDAGTGYVHTIEVTPANVHDVTVASELIREDDEVIYGDSAYLGSRSARKWHMTSACPPLITASIFVPAAFPP